MGLPAHGSGSVRYHCALASNAAQPLAQTNKKPAATLVMMLISSHSLNRSCERAPAQEFGHLGALLDHVQQKVPDVLTQDR